MKIINKFIIELRYNSAPIIFDIQGKIVNSYYPHKFDTFQIDSQSVAFKTTDKNLNTELRISISNFVFTIENMQDKNKFLDDFQQFYNIFKRLNITNKIIRIGIRSFVCHFGHSFSNVINRTKTEVFGQSGLLDALSESFQVDDFNIVLENKDITNRIEFGVIKKGEKDLHLDMFSLLDRKNKESPRAPEDLLLVDTDYANQDQNGLTNIFRKARRLYSSNINTSENLSKFYVKENKNDKQ